MFVLKIIAMAKVCCVLAVSRPVLSAFLACLPESFHMRRVWQGLAVPMCVSDSILGQGFSTLALLAFGTFGHY